MSNIDFVVTWVDGSDPVWLAERAQYLQEAAPGAAARNRYRDWELMRCWFRGVEQFAPWVNRIFFVTWGHCPAWLDLSHPRLTVVKHTDYIPRDKLPTFNSNVIELYLHKIPQLGEQFVLFNDDMFLTKPVRETDFFQKGLPCDAALLGTAYSATGADLFSHAVLNNSGVINRHFSKQEVLKRHWQKFFSLKYGAGLFRNLLLLPFRYVSSFYDTHLPTSHLKSTFEEVWDKEGALLESCTGSRFRARTDVTHWLMKNWRFCQGQFVPRSCSWGKCFEIGKDMTMLDAIRNQRYRVICLNDSDPGVDFEAQKAALKQAFEAILPEKSAFER